MSSVLPVDVVARTQTERGSFDVDVDVDADVDVNVTVASRSEESFHVPREWIHFVFASKMLATRRTQQKWREHQFSVKVSQDAEFRVLQQGVRVETQTRTTPCRCVQTKRSIQNLQAHQVIEKKNRNGDPGVLLWWVLFESHSARASGPYLRMCPRCVRMSTQ